MKVVSGATSAAVNVMVGGAGTLTLVVKDSAGNTDTAVINFTAAGTNTLAPSVAGTAASACIADMTVTPAAPTVSAAYSPASVAANASATLGADRCTNTAMGLCADSVGHHRCRCTAGLDSLGTSGAERAPAAVPSCR